MEEKRDYYVDKNEAGRLSEADLDKVAGGSTKPCLNCSSYSLYYGTANCPNSCYYKNFG